MVRIIHASALRNGSPMNYRAEHYNQAPMTYKERDLLDRKAKRQLAKQSKRPQQGKHKNHKAGKMPNLRGGGR